MQPYAIDAIASAMKTRQIPSFAICLSFLLLTACAASNQNSTSQVQKQVVQIQAALENRAETQKNCLSAMNQLPSVKMGQSIIYHDQGPLKKFELFSSNAKLPDDLKQPFLDFLAANNNCRKEVLNASQDIPPDLIELSIAEYRKFDSIYGKLLAREITIGEANSALEETRTQFKLDFEKAMRKLQVKLDQEYENEIFKPIER